jgi:hypothetical protein
VTIKTTLLKAVKDNIVLNCVYQHQIRDCCLDRVDKSYIFFIKCVFLAIVVSHDVSFRCKSLEKRFLLFDTLFFNP